MGNGNRSNRRKGTKSGKSAGQGDGRAPTRHLAWQQFRELNFSFYREQPSDFINMRIEMLSLMLCDEQDLAPAYGADRVLKGITFSATTPPSLAKRKQYLQTEAVMILHHSAEMLFRLFYAHVENDSCPWLGMASLTNFAEFKKKLNESLSKGFDRAVIAAIFLGGISPEEAGISLSEEDFEDAIDGYILLLQGAAHRILTEAFLYNSIKHGLSTIALEEETEIASQSPTGEKVVVHRGPMFAYMHKTRRPGAERGEREWFVSTSGVKTECDIALAMLIARAVESLWDVARRKYTGVSGSIRHMKKDVVELVRFGLIQDAMNLLDTYTMEMPKLREDGSYSDIEGDFRMHGMPDGYTPAKGVHPTDCPRVDLPVRQQDHQVFSTSSRRFFPFSPNGSQAV